MCLHCGQIDDTEAEDSNEVRHSLTCSLGWAPHRSRPPDTEGCDIAPAVSSIAPSPGWLASRACVL